MVEWRGGEGVDMDSTYRQGAGLGELARLSPCLCRCLYQWVYCSEESGAVLDLKVVIQYIIGYSRKYTAFNKRYSGQLIFWLLGIL